MIKNCSHELVHYLQFVKRGRSSCKSDLEINNGNCDHLLVQEHKIITRQIYQLITTSSEYSQRETRWKEI